MLLSPLLYFLISEERATRRGRLLRLLLCTQQSIASLSNFLVVSLSVCAQCFVEHNWFNLIGIICGLAIYNSTVVDLHFPLVLYKKLLGVAPTLEDLKELSPTEGR